jgi:hypothetical protein
MMQYLEFAKAAIRDGQRMVAIDCLSMALRCLSPKEPIPSAIWEVAAMLEEMP